MRQKLYNLAAALCPGGAAKDARVLKACGREDIGPFLKIMRRHRVFGASFALFDARGIRSHIVYGDAHRGAAAGGHTFYRVASVSKMITAACVLKLAELGLVALDEDVNGLLPFSVNNGWNVTLRTLLCHCAGLRDGATYLRGVGGGAKTTDMLCADNYRTPGAVPAWAYSNLGAGLVACVLECCLGLSFERIMQRYLFEPMGVRASFYPRHIQGDLADAFQVLPPKRRPAFDAAERKGRSDAGWDKADPFSHYTLSQGNCCIDMEGVVRIAQALMSPGFLARETLFQMRGIAAPFGQRDPRLSQGLGLFIVRDTALAPHDFFGHQGLAYGAVHGVFFDAVTQTGMAFMTSGASLRRDGVLTALSLDLMKLWKTWEI